MNNTQPKTMEERGELVLKILDILAFQAGITAQGWNYTGEKDWALNKILNLIDSESHLAEEALREEIKRDVERIGSTNTILGARDEWWNGSNEPVMFKDIQAYKDVLSLPSLHTTKQ